MGQVNHPGSELARIKELERQVAELRAGQSLSHAVLSKGSFEVRTDTGQTILKVGQFQYANQTVYGMALFRNDGSTQFWGWDNPGGGGFWSFWDEAGNIIVSNDTVSGQGLATPYIPLPGVPTAWHASRQQSTAATTFTALWTVAGRKQHPRLDVYLMVQCDAGVAGEVQLRDPGSGTIIDGPKPLAAGAFTYISLTGPVAGAHATTILKVDVEMRVTAGAGSVGCSLIYAQGVQS